MQYEAWWAWVRAAIAVEASGTHTDRLVSCERIDTPTTVGARIRIDLALGKLRPRTEAVVDGSGLRRRDGPGVGVEGRCEVKVLPKHVQAIGTL